MLARPAPGLRSCRVSDNSLVLRRVCVFAGSSAGSDPAYTEAARDLGATLTERGLGIVYGGAKVGLMGTLADVALEAGGEVIGVIPAGLGRREIAHPGLSDLHVVSTMHERKALMAELGDAFVALPGGLGTLDELLEATTWTQLGIHRKPVGLLDVKGYWAPLRALVDHAAEHGFVSYGSREVLLSSADPGELMDALAAWHPAGDGRWTTG